MNRNFTNVMTFIAGAAVGSFVTWKLIRDRYEQIANEEIASVKKKFSKRKTEEEQPETEADRFAMTKEEKKQAVTNYSAILTDTGYADEKKQEEDKMNEEKPYVIEPGEFGEMDGYETVSLTYYADGIIEDENGNCLETDEVADLVGRESLEHFGEYEDDSVFVRNDAHRTDYEILADCDRYQDLHPSQNSSDDND